MVTHRLDRSRPVPEGFSFAIALLPLASFAFALDVALVLLFALMVLGAVCLLWHRTSPRHKFILDLMTAQSDSERSVTVLPAGKKHNRVLQKSA